jgi:hypothetical protein
MQNTLEAFILRLPSQLHAKVKCTAKEDRRSMNNEIVVRLERSYEVSQNNAENDTIKILLMEKIKFLEEKVKAYERVPGNSNE